MRPAAFTSPARPAAIAGENRHRKRAPIGLRVAAHRDHFRGHGNGDLLRRDGADIEAHGRMQALERRARHAFLLQFPDHAEHFALAADHGDVAGRRGDGQLQHAHIVAMAARHDDDVAGFVDGQLGEDVFVLGGVHFVGFGKALAAGESLAVVDHHGGEARQGGHLGQALRNVAGAENEGARHGQHRLDENVQLAAADQAVVVSRVLAQVERQALAVFRFR